MSAKVVKILKFIIPVVESKSGIVNVAFLELKVVLEISHIPIHDDNLIASPSLFKQY